MGDRKGRGWRPSLFFLFALGLFAAISGTSSAADIHVLKNHFGQGELALSRTSGIALNQKSGVLYVGDTGNGRVAEFAGSTGLALGTLTTAQEPTFVAVDNSPGTSSGAIYVVEAIPNDSTITKFDEAGVIDNAWGAAGHLSGLGEVDGIAVDDAGRLWVFTADGRLRSFAPDFKAGQEPLTNCILAESVGGSPNGISLDASGAIYLTLGGGQLRGVNSSCSSLTNEVPEVIGTATDVTDGSLYWSTTVGYPNHGRNNSGKFEVLEEDIGRSATNEGLAVEEGEERAQAGQMVVSPSTGRLLVSVPSRNEIFDFGLENVDPPALEGPEVSAVSGTSATFTGRINPHRPPGANALPYSVHYEFNCTPFCSGVGPETVPADETSHLAEFSASGLTPNTTYKVELIARNAGGSSSVPEASSPVEFTTSAVAPSVFETLITRASETEAVVEAVVNPGGAETNVQFEYVSLAQWELSGFTSALTTMPTRLPGVQNPEDVSATIKGLLPETRYKLRASVSNLVATNVPGPEMDLRTQESSLPFAGCPNALFRIGGGEFLPDCRGYEQATPVSKNGGSAAGISGLVQAAEGGAAISFYSQAGVPGGVGAQDFPTFVAGRTPTAWSNQGLLPPQSLGEKAVVLGLSSSDQNTISQVEREGLRALVSRNLTTGETKFIVPYRPACKGQSCFAYSGSSLDGTRIFFESTLPVTQAPVAPPAIEEEVRNLYMWNSVTGKIVLVGVSATGEPLPQGSIGGPFDWIQENTLRGGAFANYYTGAIHAISSSGDQAVFTEAGSGQLFARVGLTGPNPATVHISENQFPASEIPERESAFLGASPDGRFVFFKTRAELTEDAYSGECCSRTESLYRYDLSSRKLVDLTPDPTKSRETGPGVQGVVGVSADGQVAYFVAQGVLTGTATQGAENLYRFDSERTPPLTLVATLAGEGSEDPRVWNPVSGGTFIPKTGRVSANGEEIVFGSQKPLTGYNNQSPGCRATGNHGPCLEFFRWSGTTEKVECITCDATGAIPIGPASLSSPFINAEIGPEVNMAPVLTRNLTEDGTRFFFQTPDPLSGRDTNANAGCPFSENGAGRCLDVYEWEAAGTGSCRSAAVAGGCIQLLSSGASAEPSYFGDADREGENVFLFTSSQLVPADRDTLYDIYDVAENGGLASQWAETEKPCDSTEECGGSRAQAIPAGNAGSESFVGAGNVKRKPCPKHGKKCKAGKHHKKKHHKKKHHKKKHHKKKHQGSHARPGRMDMRHHRGEK